MVRIIVFCCFFGFVAFAQETLSEDRQYAVKEFIGWIKNGQQDSLVAHTRFPLQRQYPIPSIMTASELIARFDEVFDSTLINEIITSNPATDWDEVGWRGIMLNNGEVWVDIDGSLLAVNYQSAAEHQMMTDMLAKDRALVHASLKTFKSLEYVLETRKHRIRIDQIDDGHYRYASWKINHPMSDKPDIIVSDGELDFDGSGGNHHITFKNGVYMYVIDVIVLGDDDDPPAHLSVYKGEKEVLSEDAIIVGR